MVPTCEGNIWIRMSRCEIFRPQGAHYFFHIHKVTMLLCTLWLVSYLTDKHMVSDARSAAWELETLNRQREDTLYMHIQISLLRYQEHACIAFIQHTHRPLLVTTEKDSYLKLINVYKLLKNSPCLLTYLNRTRTVCQDIMLDPLFFLFTLEFRRKSAYSWAWLINFVIKEKLVKYFFWVKDEFSFHEAFK